MGSPVLFCPFGLHIERCFFEIGGEQKPEEQPLNYQNISCQLQNWRWFLGGLVVWISEAMRCLASMENVGQCYASTIAGELGSHDPESRAAACETLGKLGDYGAAFTEEIDAWWSGVKGRWHQLPTGSSFGRKPKQKGFFLDEILFLRHTYVGSRWDKYRNFKCRSWV